MTSTGRAGGGIVIGIIFLLLLVLLVIQLQQSFFSETVLEEAAAAQIGALAITVAESTLDELQAAVRACVNDPAHPAFAKLREFMTKDPSAEAFDVSPLPGAGERTRGMLGSPTYAVHGFTVDIGPTKVLFRKLFNGPKRSYNESFGSIAYRITVAATKTRTAVVRTLEATQDFKVLAAGMPPPFDQVPLLLEDAEATVGGEEANRTAEYFAKTRKDYIDFFADLEKKLAALPADQRGLLTKIRKNFEIVPEFQSGKSPGDYPPEVVHAFKFPMAAYRRPAAESGQASDTSGAAIELGLKLKDMRSEIEGLDKEAQDAIKALRQSGTQVGENIQRRLETAVDKLAVKLIEHQSTIRQWQLDFGELVDKDREDITFDLSHLRNGTTVRKASFRIDEKTAGGGVGAAFDKMLADTEARTGTRALHGLVFVDNPGAVLDLSGRSIAGRVVIAASGAVRVGRTTAAGPDDRLAVVANGTLTVSGDVTGGLIGLGDVKVEAPSTVTGPVTFAKSPSGALLNLTVKHDPKQLGHVTEGGKRRYIPDYYRVVVAPQISSKQILRARSP